MSNFKALNLESDTESDDEVDNTKEIQIEDALKLYQTALKYHSEGFHSFDKAKEAYEALFASEIFKYPESLSEHTRSELFDDVVEFDYSGPNELAAGPVQASSDSAPNTLPQVLHLAYKNHGQLMLDILLHREAELARVFSEQEGDLESSKLAAQLIEEAAVPLKYFAEALDKDDDDVELWSRTASVSNLVASHRLARFCLEAVLDGDEEGLDSILRLPGLQESYALQKLRALIETLQDDLSLNQEPLSKVKRRSLPSIVRNRLERYQSEALASIGLDFRRQRAEENRNGRKPQRVSLHPVKTDWASVGDSILKQFLAEQGALADNGPGLGIEIFIDAEGSSPMQEPEPSITAPLPSISSPVLQVKEPSAAPDAQLQQSPVEEDTTMHDAPAETSDKKPEQAIDVTDAQPSRKRSTDSAGLPESAEGGRSRSKRIRARESIVEGAAVVDSSRAEMAKEMINQLWNFEQADHFLFTIANDLFGRIGIQGPGSSDELRLLFPNSTGTSPKSTENSDFQPILDLFNILQGCTPKLAAMLLTGDSIDQIGGLSRTTGLNSLLGASKATVSSSSAKPVPDPNESLAHWVTGVNSEWLVIKEVAFNWVECLLKPGSFPNGDNSAETRVSSYVSHQWPDDLKRNVVQIIVNLDDFIYDRLLEQVSRLNSRILGHSGENRFYACSHEDCALIDFAQTLFELHLDIYSLITHPSSQVDASTRAVQCDRLERWANLARDGINICQTRDDVEQKLDDLSIRHIWASAFHLGVLADISQNLVLHCMEDLQQLFKSLGDRTIHLQNNAIMPELSIAAVDRELAAINMRDFFKKVFAEDDEDPVATIENLEPILEPSVANAPSLKDEDNNLPQDSNDEDRNLAIQTDSDVSERSAFEGVRKFLETASTPLRLSLWQRLREAYETIDYSPKIVSCYLRSIELIISSLRSPSYNESSEEKRQLDLLTGLRLIDEILQKVLALYKVTTQAFDCLDELHLISTMGSISELIKLVTATNIYEDLLRVGQIQPPALQGRPLGNYTAVLGNLHDIYIRAWCLQYLLLKECIDQNPTAFESPNDDRFEFLRHIHYAAGTRQYGHAAGKWFLRLLRDELLQMKTVSDDSAYENEMAQVLFDLYGLKCFTDPTECMDYGSTVEVLERKTAPQLLEFLMAQAEKLSMKEVTKTDLKPAIDKVHGALGRPKANEDMAQNRKVITAFLKSPLLPLDLYRCLDGVGSLATIFVTPERAIAASKGWYFLMGSIALTKFRSQKRVVPGPTEDLNFAMAFFMQDLEYSIEKWETWYRLAQTYDTQLEELVSWSAEKMNAPSFEINQNQRSAIHAYTMAVAGAEREADTSEETATKMSEMYSDFGMRIYSSSREPFSMLAFNPKDTEIRFLSKEEVTKAPTYQPMPLYSAWKFASVLFKRAIRGKPSQWMNYYMLAKCLWKMHCAQEGDRGPSTQDVVNALVRAIEHLPDKKDGNRREPILEPHYKLVSVIHKLVMRKELEAVAASEILKATPYTKNVGAPSESDAWEEYMLRMLKALRAADKSGWHHRLTARAAHVIYDEASLNIMAAMGAKHELSQQIFTKTMAIQVWKPEFERTGRHFVYTTRYSRFFLQLLIQLNDRTSLEALAKRVRKKPHEFYEHTKLWQEICLAYLRMLRRAGTVPEGHEDAIFKSLNHEEFVVKATRLESWSQDSKTQSALLDVLRETLELKRLNNNLIKPILIDDLIGDTYALLYEQITPTLQPLPSEAPKPSEIPAATAEKTNMMSLNHLLMNVDGVSSTPPQVPAQIPEQALARPRAKNVGRREIQKRAEAATNRPLATAPTYIPPSGNSIVQVVIQTPNRRRSEPMPNADGEGSLAVPKQDLGESSAPGSVHDSADDESELSDLEEDDEADDEGANDEEEPTKDGIDPDDDQEQEEEEHDGTAPPSPQALPHRLLDTEANDSTIGTPEGGEVVDTADDKN